MSKGLIFADANNIKEHIFLHNPLAIRFGFYSAEVEQLFNSMNIPPKDREGAQKFYGGYQTINAGGEILESYDPWGVISFLSDRKLITYWSDNEEIDFIESIFRIKNVRKEIEQLLKGESIRVDFTDLGLSKRDFEGLRELASKASEEYEITSEILNNVYKYMYSIGYLTLTGEDETRDHVRIPNLQIGMDLAKRLQVKLSFHHFSRKFHSDLLLLKISDS